MSWQDEEEQMIARTEAMVANTMDLGVRIAALNAAAVSVPHDRVTSAEAVLQRADKFLTWLKNDPRQIDQ